MKITEEEKKLLDEEEQELAKVQSSLIQQQKTSERRFQTEKDRARTLTSEMVATRRLEDKHQLASDEALAHKMRDFKLEELGDIEKLIENPYFARIVLEEEVNGKIKLIQYKIGLRGNTDVRIIDWRKAPISKLYYEYQEGEEYFEIIQGREREGIILSRNKVRIEDGVLVEVTNSKGTFFKEGADWKKGLAPTRKSNASGRMPDVLSLITPEQFKSITEEADSAVLIQGIAGSGKTTVAVHRLSWLLHDGNSGLKPSDALVLLKSKVLRSYIEDSLKALGTENVPVFTYSQWIQKLVEKILAQKPKLPKEKPSYLTFRLKCSAAMLSAIEGHVKSQSKWVLNHLRENLNLSELGAHIEKCLDEQQILEDAPLAFLSQLRSLVKANPDSAVYPMAHSNALELIEGLSAGLKNYKKDIIDVLSNHQAIVDADDSNFIDKKYVAEAKATSEKTFEEGALDQADQPLIVLLSNLKTGKAVNHFGSTSPYGHIAIDEVQDFRPIELAAVLTSAKSKMDVTLSGDSAQDLKEGGAFQGWEQLRTHWGMESAQYVELKVSHRSTTEIMRFSHHLINRNNTIEGRRGKPPLWYHTLNEENGYKEMAGWLETVVEKYPQSLTAVLCSSRSEVNYVHSLLEPSFGPILRIGAEDSFSFEEGVTITQTQTVKGLEFKNVLVWNVSEKAYPKRKHFRNLLYTASTRAEDNLCLISFGKQSPILPSIHSKLVRGHLEEVEEKESYDPRELR